MFIELVDALRCPHPHEDSWLVASATVMESRHIVEGALGCPVCRAEYPVHEGVVDFRRNMRVSGAAAYSGPGDPQQAMRLAAFMNLSDAQGFAVLLGAWCTHAAELSAVCDVPLVLVDPPAGITGAAGLSVIRCDGDLPMAAAAARAVAIDAGDASRIASAVRITRAKGRVVATAGIPLPTGVRELARDETTWVGEREAIASPLVSLHVRRG